MISETPGREKLDLRLRALAELTPESLRRTKNRDDVVRRDEIEAIKALDEHVRTLQGDEFAKELNQLRERILRFPIPPTFGLYLPEGPEARARVGGLQVPCVSAIVRSQASAEDLTSLGVRIRSQAGDVYTAYVPLELCDRLCQSSAIDYVELSRPYVPQLIKEIPKARIAQIQAAGVNGAGVIVGIIDSAVDYYHAHFQNNTGTRVLYLWDQTLSPQAGEAPPPSLPGFNVTGGYLPGVEYDRNAINAELTHPKSVPAYTIVRTNPGTGNGGVGSHGTLVASCAAGNGHLAQGTRIYIGAAPGADIISVRIDDLSSAGIADSADILDAFAYIFARADVLKQPCVVNLSLSDVLGAHDGTSNGERFLDNLLAVPGRAVTCSAGNWNIFPLHTRGLVTQGQTTDVTVVCNGATRNDTIQLWYDGDDEFEATLTIPTTPPTQIGPVGVPAAAGASVGGITVSMSSTVHPNNNDNLLEIRLTDVTAQTPIPDGDWVIALRGVNVINGTFNGWIDYRNLFGVAWQNAVFDEGTIDVPATGRRVIGVGGHMADGGACDRVGDPKPTIQSISGCGPTRDGRVKPDLVAPGEVNGAMSRDMNAPPPQGYPITNGSYGTSNAAPIVAGAVALVFQARGGGLTSDDLKQLLINAAAQPAGGVPSNSFGFGYLCMGGLQLTRRIDVWIRDSPTDAGLEPYSGDLGWLSPDINILDAGGNSVPNPTYDPGNLWNNIVNVTVSNRGTANADNVSVYLYWADPATNLPFPAEWKTDGIYGDYPSFVSLTNKAAIQQIPANGGQVTVSFAWAPPPPASNLRGDDHFCLIARAEQDDDPSNVGPGGWPVITGSNNIAMRNVHVQQVATDNTMAFCVIGTGHGDSLELSRRDVRCGVELFLPTRALPWHELGLLERLRDHRPEYGSHRRDDPAEAERRVLRGSDLTRILGVRGAEEAQVNGARTRIIVADGDAPVTLSEVRVRRGTRLPLRVWARRARLAGESAALHVRQRAGGKITGGVSLWMVERLPEQRRYVVRRGRDRAVVEPRN